MLKQTSYWEKLKSEVQQENATERQSRYDNTRAPTSSKSPEERKESNSRLCLRYCGALGRKRPTQSTQSSRKEGTKVVTLETEGRSRLSGKG